jgi:phytanoyl-CoA hydroxylase
LKETTLTLRLSSKQLEFYEEQGYLLVENLMPVEEVAALGKRLREYTHGEREHPGLVFQHEPRVARGELKVEHPGDGIRKVDYLVQNDDQFEKLGKNPNIVGIVRQILGPDLKMFRNTLLLKPPEVGSAKGWHQDSPYWPIEPMALCSCWFPLDDATPENGCMVVLPGWHKKGPLPHIHVTDDFVIQENCLDMDKAIMCPMKAGSGLFFHSLLPHYTAPNCSGRWRRAIALSYMSARSHYTGEGEGPAYYPIQGETFPGCVR